jgi:hypothetical protein
MNLSVDPAFFDLLTESHARLVGAPLIPPGEGEQNAAWLYHEAQFCVLAHDTDPDPRFIYGNRAAQACFEYDWDALTSLPSRLSAEAPNRDERQKMLDAVTSNGFATGYRGLRIAASGRRFWIEDGIVWQLIDREGVRHGQAAVFRRWRDA